MQKIHKLSSDIVAKIAAGEIIERPMYVVKELIENAIDAHATSITIHIEEAGLKKIQVIDNGEGMSKEDLEVCFLPHTTSKIKEEDELLHIRTLGFRGEALSSIAAISRLTIQSRQKSDSSGTIIEIQNRRIEHIGSVGTPYGTIVTVSNLFYAIPARKKFLKSIQTEFRHISDIVLQFALSYPALHLTLTHNKKTIVDLPTKTNMQDRLTLIFGSNLDNLLPVRFSDSYLSVSGFVGKPHISSKNNQQQYLFVNNRAVSDKLVALAVKESYGTILSSSSTPVYALHLSVPYEMLDVNIHPRKEQINFVHARMIFDLIKQAISETLTHNNITYSLETFDSSKKGETNSLSAIKLKDIVLPWNRNDIGEISKNTPYIQIHQLYILTITEKGIVLIDQHAAHERILFEQFTKIFENEKKQKNLFSLSKPFIFSVTLSEKQVIEEYKNNFEKIGFLLESFGGNTYVIRTIPVLFKGRKLDKILRDMISDLAEQGTVKTIDTTSQRMLAFLSCRAAIKAGDVVTISQMKKIVKDLEASPNKVTCPHGRPTQIILPLELLHQYFKRI